MSKRRDGEKLKNEHMRRLSRDSELRIPQLSPLNWCASVSVDGSIIV